MAEAPPLLVKFLHLHEAASKAPAGEAILETCLELAEMLVEKNTMYGDSAMNPIRVFSQASPIEQLFVRMDDKLKRIMNQLRNPDSGDREDQFWDLAGYLVLYLTRR